MQKLGFIKIHRKIMNSEIWADPVKYKLWNYCLLKATHTDRTVIINEISVELTPGQFVTGRFALEEEFNKGAVPSKRVSGISLMRYLKSFASLGMLNIKTTSKYSLVTVLNWGEYQDTEQQTDIKPTSIRQQTDTNKNVKNDKNDKNVNIYSEVIPYKQIIDHLNQRTGRSFRVTDTYRKHINARFNEGFTLEDFKIVIDKKCVEWTGTKMEQYLRPQTLFGTKFDGYLNQDMTNIKKQSSNPYLNMTFDEDGNLIE